LARRSSTSAARPEGNISSIVAARCDRNKLNTKQLGCAGGNSGGLSVAVLLAVVLNNLVN
jgi:hypothetical protein